MTSVCLPFNLSTPHLQVHTGQSKHTLTLMLSGMLWTLKQPSRPKVSHMFILLSDSHKNVISLCLSSSYVGHLRLSLSFNEVIQTHPIPSFPSSSSFLPPSSPRREEEDVKQEKLTEWHSDMEIGLYLRARRPDPLSVCFGLRGFTLWGRNWKNWNWKEEIGHGDP